MEISKFYSINGLMLTESLAAWNEKSTTATQSRTPDITLETEPLSFFLSAIQICCGIMGTRLFKYIENFTTKNWKFSDKNSDIFHISAQNIDCGYSLELPCIGCSNQY